MRQEPPETRVAAARVQVGVPLLIHVGGWPVVVTRLPDAPGRAGGIVAFLALCPHQEGPLDQGSYDPKEGTVTCPWHHYRYDLRTGRNVYPYDVYPPDMRERYAAQLGPLRFCEVRALGQELEVRLPADLATGARHQEAG